MVLTIKGGRRQLTGVAPGTPLLWALGDQLGHDGQKPVIAGDLPAEEFPVKDGFSV